MKIKNTITILAIAAALAGCGQATEQSDKPKSDSKPLTKADLEEQSRQLDELARKMKSQSAKTSDSMQKQQEILNEIQQLKTESANSENTAEKISDLEKKVQALLDIKAAEIEANKELQKREEEYRNSKGHPNAVNDSRKHKIQWKPAWNK